MKDALQAGFRIRRIEQLSAVPRPEPSTSAKEIILDLSDRLSAINSIAKKLQSAPNVEGSDTTGDASSNVAGNITDYEKQLEEKFLPEIIAANKQYSLSEVKELLKKQRENCLKAAKITPVWHSELLGEAGPGSGYTYDIDDDSILNAAEPDLTPTPNKDKEGIDVASDSKPDEALLATLGSDSGNSIEQGSLWREVAQMVVEDSVFRNNHVEDTIKNLKEQYVIKRK